MSQTKEIYWVCRSVTPEVTQKVNLLQKYHIRVRLLSDFASLLKAYSENRLNTIVIGDEGDNQSMESAMTRLSNHPEYAGVRFVLSVSKAHKEITARAVDLGFRDIIPIDLSDAHWLRRYAFASSGRPTELHPPHPQISMQSLASVQIPGRIAWITEKELWLETRLTPPVGTELSISGGLADLLGLKQVRLKVMNRYKSHLHFRYSEALLCRWEVAPSHQVRKLAVQNFMNEQGSNAHYRFYAIVKNKELRNQLVKGLPADRYQLTVALNKNNMIQEPRFISPDAVLIEDKMCLGPHQQNFEDMLKNLDIQVPVFVFGDAARLIKGPTEHRFIPMPNMVGADFHAFFEAELGAPKTVNIEATSIPKNHALSFANVILPARITHLHPDFVEIVSTYPLGRFGLFGLDAPVFQASVEHKVHGKVLDTSEGEGYSALKEFPFRSRAIIIDLAKPEREKLSRHLVDLFRQQMLPKGTESLSPNLKATSEIPTETLREAQKIDENRDIIPIGGRDPVLVREEQYPDVMGAGPMRTEVARIRDIRPEPTQGLTSSETEVRPLAEALHIEKRMKENRVRSFTQLVMEMIHDIPREWKIWGFAVLCMVFALWLAFVYRQPLENQAPEMTEQLRIFKEQHSGKHPPSGPPVETFEP